MNRKGLNAVDEDKLARYDFSIYHPPEAEKDYNNENKIPHLVEKP